MRRALPRWGMVVALALLAGCGAPEARLAPPPPSAAFFPSQFPDIPLPLGYVPSPDHDQLALALAGGTVRRFEVVLEQRETAAPQAVGELLERCRRDLSEQGWQLLAADPAAQRWIKGREVLSLEAGRTGARTTISFRLRPAVEAP